MPKIAVIFDTNACHIGRTQQTFFGQREIMTEISQRASLLVPQVVIDELIQQNMEGTQENITNLKNNPLLPTLEFDLAKLDEIVNDTHAKKLYQEETIPHHVVDISDIPKAYENIRKWSITGSPPFNSRTGDGKNNSDKGIKDALVACTIDELLMSSDEYDEYYLACFDGRLKDYYKDNPRVKCLGPKEILAELQNEFFDAYTIEFVQKELDKPLASLKGNYLNINKDVIGEFEHEGATTFVLFDATSKEIIKSADSIEIAGLNELVTCGSYQTAHDIVAEILSSLDFYNEKQLQEIKNTLLINDQLYGIGTDEDIKTLASHVFNYFSATLSDGEKRHFDVYYELREA